MDPITKLVSLGAAGAGSESYWILTKTANSSGYADYFYDVDINTNGDAIVVGRTHSTYYAGYILKVDTDGSVLFERRLYSPSSNVSIPAGVATYGSSDIYVCYRINLETHFICKPNSAGSALTWSKKYYQSSGQGDEATQAIATDSSGNVYATGTSMPGSFTGQLIPSLYKINSSGALQWFVFLDGSNETSEPSKDIAIDSSNNIYITGYSAHTGAGSNDIFIAKYNSSGTLQWQKFIGGSGADYNPFIAIDSSNNPVITYRSRVGSSSRCNTAKFNSSGTLQWERSIQIGSRNSDPHGIAIDSADNVYVNSQMHGSAPEDYIFKYNSSGVLQWQTGVTGPSNYVRTQKMDIDDKDSLWVTAYGGTSPQDAILLKLPTDDVVTPGTYGGYVFSSSSATDAAGSSTVTNGTMTASTQTNRSAVDISTSFPTVSLTSSLTTI